MKAIHISLSMLICVAAARAQSDERYAGQSQLSVTGYFGKILPHDDTLKPLTHNTVKGINFSIFQKVNGSKSWHYNHKWPHVGLSFLYIDLGDGKVLGKAYGLQPKVSYQILRYNKFVLHTEFGLGLAYINRKYSLQHNPTNVAISTRLNYWGMLRIMTNLYLSKNLSFAAGFETNHFSNGAIKKPNYGLNMVGYSLGFSYKMWGEMKDKVSDEPHQENQGREPHLVLTAGAGIKETGPAGGPKYYPITASIHYQMPREGILHYLVGLDFMFDKSMRYHVELVSNGYSPISDDIQLGFKAGVIVPMDRLFFYGNLGVYLYNPNPRVSPLYQKLGVGYQLAHKAQLNLELKTHLNIADHIGVGLAIDL